ncbi:MOSC domain-containing protein [Kribbella sp. NPDC051952]|uniref:MOSC domain-containing protein n=1 Tax=Kribbella sp. NPDC051952 TaxID=3154851 RepID=UPI0034331C71
MSGIVVGVSRDSKHRFSKAAVDAIRVIEGYGVEGDAHAGQTIQHLHPMRLDPTRPNLRQVHLIQFELYDELGDLGYDVSPGQLGENVTTRGVDLLALPRRTRLQLGPDVVLEVTGLRSPCRQINNFRPGLLKEVIHTDEDGTVVRKTGVMSIVVVGGIIHPDDPITVVLPDGDHEPLEVV